MADLAISDLDPELILQNEAYLISFLASKYPSMDLSEGRVLRTLLIRPAAIFHTLRNENLDRLRLSSSLAAIEADPTLADDQIVDNVLSNYRVTRHPGSKASGQLTIVISNLSTTTVEISTIFTALGLKFTGENTYVGVTTQSAVLSEQQRLIVARNDGSFAFNIPIVAAEVGDEYRLKRGTRVTMDPAPPGFIDAFVAADFSGGSDVELNSALIERFKLGISPKVFSGRVQIEALLRETVEIKQTSIVGFGDPEMLRDRHNLFLLSHGGKADIYARTYAAPIAKLIVKTATLISAAEQLWQVSLGRDDAPGFYSVESILRSADLEDQATLEITDEVRGLDLTSAAGEFVPEVKDLLEGSYSRYQTAVLQFIDPDTTLTSPTTMEVKIRALHMPDIDTLQSLAVDRGARNPQADYLVRAPVPAFVTMSLKVLYRDGAKVPDVGAIQRAVADRVNSLGFTMGRLPVSVIYDAVHNSVDAVGTAVSSPIDMTGRILMPAGGAINLRSTHELVLPNRPADGVTPRTTVFYVDPLDVDVLVEKVSTLPI